jgi:general secretion pathway protein I
MNGLATPSCGRAHAALGFTLIEVLAALVIVALGMLGVIEAVTQAARNGTYLREKTLAHWIAMNLITERRLAGAPPDVTESKGDLDYAGQRWHWTVKVTQTQVETMRRMDVTVRAADAAEGSSLASAMGFYGTAIGPAGGGLVKWAGSGGAPGTGGTDQDGSGSDQTDFGTEPDVSAGDDHSGSGDDTQSDDTAVPPNQPAEPVDDDD